MAFTGKYLNIRMTDDVSDLGKAKIYDAADCASPKLHLRSTAGADHAVPLVLSSAIDSRKLTVVHSDTDKLGNVTKKRHYVHMMSGGLQYTLLRQLEGGISSGDNIQTVDDFLGDIVADRRGPLNTTIYDKISDEATQRICDPYLAVCRIRVHNNSSPRTWCKIWVRVDGVETLVADWGVVPYDDSIHTFNYPAMSAGPHTLGVHVSYQNTDLGQHYHTVYVDIISISMVTSNTGDPQ
jgi:hypothetical protein